MIKWENREMKSMNYKCKDLEQIGDKRRQALVPQSLLAILPNYNTKAQTRAPKDLFVMKMKLQDNTFTSFFNNLAAPKAFLHRTLES